MEMSSTTSPNVVVVVEKSPKTLPMKYKAMLMANISFISIHIMDELLKEQLFAILPIHKTIEEQIAFFDEEADMKKTEQNIFKPMLKEQKQKEKNANKPAKKEKKAAPPKKKKEEAKETLDVEVTMVTVDAEETVQEKELEFETEYIAPTVVKEKEKPKAAPRKKKVKEPMPKPVEEVAQEEKTQEVTEVAVNQQEKEKKVVVKKAPRKKKEVVAATATAAAAAIVAESADDYFMIPTSVIPEGKYWTKDENYRNGPIYANGKDQDGDSAPAGIVGRLEDGNVIFE